MRWSVQEESEELAAVVAGYVAVELAGVVAGFVAVELAGVAVLGSMAEPEMTSGGYLSPPSYLYASQ